MSELGKYIVIEGSDGTGKTTQRDLLRDHLQDLGHNVIVTSEPADPEDANEPLEIALHLRKLAKNANIKKRPETNLHLFAAARVEKWHNEIQPARSIGSIALSSRNYWSTEAYQGYGEGLDLSYIRAMTNLDLGETAYMQPDAAVILAIPDERERVARVVNRGPNELPDAFETRGDDFQRRIADGYLAVADHYGIPVLDASGTKAEVSSRLIAEIARQIPSLSSR